MKTITVERTIAAPIEDVFELLSDHAGYDRFRRITRSEVVRHGSPDPNGLGALREVDIGPIHFSEEITAFERPTRMDYLIKKVNLPLEHEGGTIRLETTAEGTHVTWQSTFGVTVPVIGGLLTSTVGAPTLGNGFKRVLADVDRMLAEGSGVPVGG